MKISQEEVKHIASLARLKFTDSEVTKFTNDLGSIVEFAEQLNEIDVTDVKPTAHILDIQNVFRKDETHKSYDREKLLQNAPTKAAGCISVPQVVE